MPEYMSELGYSAGRLETQGIVEAANQAGQQMGLDEVVRHFYRPYIYLDDEKIDAANLGRAQVAEVVADALTNYDGINLAVATGSPATQPNSTLHEQMMRNQHVT